MRTHDATNGLVLLSEGYLLPAHSNLPVQRKIGTG